MVKDAILKTARYNNLQILRAISIIFVIGFHLRLPGFSAGYLGVDIFLVISGFLMAEIFQKTSSLSILTRASKFYLKRIKRLLPAYLATSLLSSLVFFILVLPHERIRIIEQNLSNFLFFTNVSNWLENQYFSTALLRPTLSFWSLALELQFYLIFPFLFVWLGNKKIAVLILFSFSIVLYLILNIISPPTSFYLLPTRLWEFLIGILIAITHRSYSFLFLRKKLAFTILSLSLIFSLLIFQFSINDKLGLRNLLVVIIAGGALISSLTVTTINGFQKFLVKIGDYSYSIYLVHLPIITAIGYKKFEGNNVPDSAGSLIFALVLIAIFSFLSYRYVENIFRYKLDLKKFSILYLSFLLISSILFTNREFISRYGFTTETTNISYNAIDRAPFRCGTFTRIEILHKIFKTPNSCLLNRGFANINYLLVGNSHADSIKNSLAQYLESKNISLYIMRDNQALSMINLEVTESEIINRKISKVLLHASPGTTDPRALKKLGDFLSVRKISLVVIGPAPTYSYLVPKALFDFEVKRKPLAYKNLRTYLSENQTELEFYRQASANGWIKYIEIGSVFCAPDCVLANKDFKPFYIDSSHLTLTGSDFLILKIGPLILD